MKIIIKIKRLQRPLSSGALSLQLKPIFTRKSVKSSNVTFAKWDVLELLKLIRFINVFKSAKENLRGSSEGLRSETEQSTDYKVIF